MCERIPHGIQIVLYTTRRTEAETPKRLVGQGSGMTRVAVGSSNPVKVAATERIVGDAFEAAQAVVSVAVNSGVSEQPTGRGETVTGAENRAARALEAEPNATYGVGIEGGVAERDDPGGMWLIMWAAVTGRTETHLGAGPSIRLPAPVADRLGDGAELGPVLNDELGRDELGKREGAIGVYTAGRVDRTDALESAVAGAFGPFLR